MSEQITVSAAKVEGLLFTSMTIRERLGELFDYTVEFESRDTAIDLTALLGTSMTVKVETGNGYERYYNGMVCEAEQTGVHVIDRLVYARYRVNLVPGPWRLGDITDCRIFKDQTTIDIVKTLLREIGYTDIQTSLSGTYPKREYCVQYREDGLNFINRLLQQEGVYYYFKHSERTHTMVLADGVGAHDVAPDFDKVPYMRTADSVLRSRAAISEWATLRGVDAVGCSLTDYNPLKPKASLRMSGSEQGHDANIGVGVFDYPGTHADGERGKHLAQVRAEAMSASRSRYVGATDGCGILIGGLFTLQDYPRSELNQEYLVTAATMQWEAPGYASGSGASAPTFHCRFEALESSHPWRSLPSARKPTVVGLQTAIVTGSETDEDIAVDKYGRVQVNFHWNMPDRKNADCSCPVRVASQWAGKNWGAVSYPRVGQEVVVSFIEGDPDRPLVVGSVYNASNMPPYTLPGNKTQSGIKTRSLLGQSADFNELRFEDKKGEENFFIHAQKDMHEEVENDHVVTVDHDETRTIKNDQTETIKHDQTATIDGKRTHTVGKDDKLTVSQNATTSVDKKFKLSAGDQIELVCGQASITLKSSGEIDIKGSTIKIEGSSKVAVSGERGVSAKGMNVELKADMAAKLLGKMVTVGGDGRTTLKGSMVSVSGTGITTVSGSLLKLG